MVAKVGEHFFMNLFVILISSSEKSLSVSIGNFVTDLYIVLVLSVFEFLAHSKYRFFV